MTRQGAWLQTAEIPGGIAVFCRLCGKRTRRVFMAANTNYAEARRAATAYHWEHEHSTQHRAALDAFHAAAAPEVTDEDRILAEIFDKPIPDEITRRRQAAKAAARRSQRTPDTPTP